MTLGSMEKWGEEVHTSKTGIILCFRIIAIVPIQAILDFK